MRIIVCGYIVRGPMGGMTWHHLQYVMGLKKMGFEVYYLEDSGDSEFCCYDPLKGVNNTDPTYGLKYANHVFKDFGMSTCWGYYDGHRNTWHGPLSMRLKNLVKSADLMLNLSCSNPIRDWSRDISIKVLVDTDPVFTQIRNLTDPIRKSLSQQHTSFFTFAERIMADDCTVPNDGFQWLPTRQPIVLEVWPVLPGPSDGKCTTVMQWQSYRERTYKDQRYGLKNQSFLDYMDLPKMVNEPFEIALGSPSAPREELRGNGWVLIDPEKVTSTPQRYRRYIQSSKCEFSVAKHAYVVTNSSWFSERSAAYLASGRPVVTQDTGFSKFIETGKGLFSYSTMEEAISGISEINRHYKSHCDHARDIAKKYFDFKVVLQGLIERAMITNGSLTSNRGA